MIFIELLQDNLLIGRRGIWCVNGWTGSTTMENAIVSNPQSSRLQMSTSGVFYYRFNADEEFFADKAPCGENRAITAH